MCQLINIKTIHKTVFSLYLNLSFNIIQDCFFIVSLAFKLCFDKSPSTYPGSPIESLLHLGQIYGLQLYSCFNFIVGQVKLCISPYLPIKNPGFERSHVKIGTIKTENSLDIIKNHILITHLFQVNSTHAPQ